MKLKYYLRGLGIGIAVTAFIMSSVKETEKLTDAQIKMRALELGMVEETVLADLPQAAREEEEKKDTSVEKGSADEERFEYTAGEADILKLEEETQKVDDENVNEAEGNAILENENQLLEDSGSLSNAFENKDENEVTTSIQKPETDGEMGSTEQINTAQSNQSEIVESYIIIPVEPGNGSETISRRLYNAGLVESAVEYNRFLVENGYDRSLVVGNHEIPAGASEEDMAKILCGLQ